MKSTSILSKVLSSIGMIAVGDALAFAISPKRHVRVWSFPREPKWYRRASASAIESPKKAYAIAALELAGELALLVGAQRLISRRS